MSRLGWIGRGGAQSHLVQRILSRWTTDVEGELKKSPAEEKNI